MSRRGRSTPQLTVIWWRDIPAQVVARAGAQTVKASLPVRFQAAIDRAAMRAGVVGSDAYLDLWQRRSRPCGDDLQAEVDAEVAQLDARFPPEALAALVRATAPPPLQKEPLS
ncbi:virulence factor [soil metagenome]